MWSAVVVVVVVVLVVSHLLDEAHEPAQRALLRPLAFSPPQLFPSSLLPLTAVALLRAVMQVPLLPPDCLATSFPFVARCFRYLWAAVGRLCFYV